VEDVELRVRDQAMHDSGADDGDKWVFISMQNECGLPDSVESGNARQWCAGVVARVDSNARALPFHGDGTCLSRGPVGFWWHQCSFMARS